VLAQAQQHTQCPVQDALRHARVGHSVMRLQKGRSHAAASRVQAERRSLISMARLEGGILQGRQGDRR